jgi:hypothetical protein
LKTRFPTSNFLLSNSITQTSILEKQEPKSFALSTKRRIALSQHKQTRKNYIETMSSCQNNDFSPFRRSNFISHRPTLPHVGGFWSGIIQEQPTHQESTRNMQLLEILDRAMAIVDESDCQKKDPRELEQ